LFEKSINKGKPVTYVEDILNDKGGTNKKSRQIIEVK
jgi:hypothetical protein